MAVILVPILAVLVGLKMLTWTLDNDDADGFISMVSNNMFPLLASPPGRHGC